MNIMDKLRHHRTSTITAIVLISSILIIRAALLDILPLYDTTEARYAEIARIMSETNNWVTPQIDYGQPFWGKPPFHTWISAASFSIFGVSALAARLPHFICGLIVLVLVYRFAKDYGNQNSGLVSCLVLASSLGFPIAMGMVMTDIALLLSITIAMMSFWKAHVSAAKHFYGHLFFAALALGMLVKGPVAIVLVGISLFVWSTWQKQFMRAITVLPWLSGIALFLILTLPWYLLAESQTPGFLEYFIVGEHFQRFLISGWEGDLYGNAHDKPRGTIWLYGLIAAFPWSFVLLTQAYKRFVLNQQEITATRTASMLLPYLLCWMISPMLLFTLSGNVLIAYVLPGFSALALLVTYLNFTLQKALLVATVTLALIGAIPIVHYANVVNTPSEIELLGEDPAQYEHHSVYYWKKRPYSAAFYSRGKAMLIANEQDLATLSTMPNDIYIAVELSELLLFTTHFGRTCIEKNATHERALLLCRGQQ